MKWSDILQTLPELRKLVREFRKSPFRATKALIIFAIFVVTVLTQLSGYTQNVSYGWMIFGLFLIIMILLVVLRVAYRFDRQMA